MTAPDQTTDTVLNALRLASDALEPSQEQLGGAPGSQLAAEQDAHAAVNDAIAHHLVTIRLGAQAKKAMNDDVGDDEFLNAIQEVLERLPAPTR